MYVGTEVSSGLEHVFGWERMLKRYSVHGVLECVFRWDWVLWRGGVLSGSVCSGGSLCWVGVCVRTGVFLTAVVGFEAGVCA